MFSFIELKLFVSDPCCGRVFILQTGLVFAAHPVKLCSDLKSGAILRLRNVEPDKQPRTQTKHKEDEEAEVLQVLLWM